MFVFPLLKACLWSSLLVKLGETSQSKLCSRQHHQDWHVLLDKWTNSASSVRNISICPCPYRKRVKTVLFHQNSYLIQANFTAYTQCSVPMQHTGYLVNPAPGALKKQTLIEAIRHRAVEGVCVCVRGSVVCVSGCVRVHACVCVGVWVWVENYKLVSFYLVYCILLCMFVTFLIGLI